MDKAVIEKSCLKQNWVMNIHNQEFDYVFIGSSRSIHNLFSQIYSIVNEMECAKAGVANYRNLFLKNVEDDSITSQI